MRYTYFTCRCEARCGSRLYSENGKLYFFQVGMDQPEQVTKVMAGFINSKFSYHPRYEVKVIRACQNFDVPYTA